MTKHLAMFGVVMLGACGTPRASTEPTAEPHRGTHVAPLELTTRELTTGDEAAALPTCVEESADFRIVYRLDDQGRVRQRESDSFGHLIEHHTYDEDGRLASVRRESSDGHEDAGLEERSYVVADSRVEVRVDSELHETWTYDERGRPIRAALQNDVEIVCEYDEAGRVEHILHVLPSTESGRHFIYDGQSVIPSRVEGHAGNEHRYVLRVQQSESWIAFEVSDEASAEHEEEGWEDHSVRWSHECHQLMFEPCSPMLVPLPPGGERALLP